MLLPYDSSDKEMIKEIHKLDTPALVDLLAAYTANHSRMLREGATDKEFAKCSLTIRSIQAEIDFRKQTAANTASADPNNNFQSGNSNNSSFALH